MSGSEKNIAQPDQGSTDMRAADKSNLQERLCSVNDSDFAESSEKPAPAKNRNHNDQEKDHETPADPLAELQNIIATTMAMIKELRTRNFPEEDDPVLRSFARVLLLHHSWILACIRDMFMKRQRSTRASEDTLTGDLIAAFRQGDANEMLAVLEEFRFDSAERDSNLLELLGCEGPLDNLEIVTEVLVEAGDAIARTLEGKLGKDIGFDGA